MAELDEAQARAMVDGVASPLDTARLRVTDDGVARGDGAFETVGVWGGNAFRLADHLDRLDRSLAALNLPAAPRRRLQEECDALLGGVTEDAALRLYVTASGTRVVTLSPLSDRGRLDVLVPQAAPWIAPPGTYAPGGAKSMSYGPNMAARRRAIQAGGDDALLHSVPDCWILEGPTFGVLFVARGIVHVPEVGLGIVDSISRRTLLEVAHDHQLDIMTGRWPLEALADADEVIVSSSLRPATAVRRVGEWTYARSHPVADTLAAGLQSRRRRTP
ncbi:MAG TPA: aminotransferase class IV [Euzebya sp.]|nr:aminotransferase class IV [Euzebya sp.]